MVDASVNRKQLKCKFYEVACGYESIIKCKNMAGGMSVGGGSL